MQEGIEDFTPEQPAVRSRQPAEVWLTVGVVVFLSSMLLQFLSEALGGLVAWCGLIAVAVGLVLMISGRSGRRDARMARDAELRQVAQAQAVERQVEQMAALQAAWERAHPGQPMPAIAAQAIAASTDRTNTPALLSLIFGILGSGLVAVILGHVAKSQIRRTGERGSGMATAGLVLGYLGLAAVIGLLIARFAVGS